MPEGIGRELERGEGWAHLLLSALAQQLLNRPPVLQYWTTVKMAMQCRAKDLYQLTNDLEDLWQFSMLIGSPGKELIAPAGERGSLHKGTLWILQLQLQNPAGSLTHTLEGG